MSTKKVVAGQPVPQRAMIFSAPTQFSATPGEGDKPAKRQFDAVAYTGDVISNHWWWDRVVFDLSTTKSPSKMPALLSHDRNQIAGFCSDITIGNDVTVKGELIMSEEAGKRVANLADAEFPWQMSVHIEPGEILEIPEGFSKEINGKQVAGPCFVFMNSTLVEASFTPTGFDPNTSARVFNRPEGDSLSSVTFTKLESSTMTPEEKATYDAAIARATQLEAAAAAGQAAIEAATASAAAAKFSARKERLKTVFSKIGVELDDDSAAPYKDMPDEAFEKTIAKFAAAKPVGVSAENAHLFRQTLNPESNSQSSVGSHDNNPVVKFSKKLADNLRTQPIQQ